MTQTTTVLLETSAFPIFALLFPTWEDHAATMVTASIPAHQPVNRTSVFRQSEVPVTPTINVLPETLVSRMFAPLSRPLGDHAVTMVTVSIPAHQLVNRTSVFRHSEVPALPTINVLLETLVSAAPAFLFLELEVHAISATSTRIVLMDCFASLQHVISLGFLRPTCLNQNNEEPQEPSETRSTSLLETLS